MYKILQKKPFSIELQLHILILMSLYTLSSLCLPIPLCDIILISEINKG